MTPAYYTCPSGVIYCGDCRDILPELQQDGSTISITSPPYNMNLRIRSGKYCSRQIVKELSTKYEDYADNLDIPEYTWLNSIVIAELLRLSSLVFYNVQFLTGNKRALYKIIGEYANNIKEFIVWDKINAEPAINKNTMNSRFEVLLVLAQEAQAISRQFEFASFDRGTLANVWSVKRGKKITKGHGAVFPEELIDKIVSNFVSPLLCYLILLPELVLLVFPL